MCKSALSSYRSAFLFPVLPFTLFVPRCALLLLPLSQSKAPSVQPLFLVLLRLWSPGRRRQRHHRRPHAVCAPSFIDLLTLGLVKRIYQRKKKVLPLPYLLPVFVDPPSPISTMDCSLYSDRRLCQCSHRSWCWSCCTRRAGVGNAAAAPRLAPVGTLCSSIWLV